MMETVILDTKDILMMFSKRNIKIAIVDVSYFNFNDLLVGSHPLGLILDLDCYELLPLQNVRIFSQFFPVICKICWFLD